MTTPIDNLRIDPTPVGNKAIFDDLHGAMIEIIEAERGLVTPVINHFNPNQIVQKFPTRTAVKKALREPMYMSNLLTGAMSQVAGRTPPLPTKLQDPRYIRLIFAAVRFLLSKDSPAVAMITDTTYGGIGPYSLINIIVDSVTTFITPKAVTAIWKKFDGELNCMVIASVAPTVPATKNKLSSSALTIQPAIDATMSNFIQMLLTKHKDSSDATFKKAFSAEKFVEELVVYLIAAIPDADAIDASIGYFDESMGLFNIAEYCFKTIIEKAVTYTKASRLAIFDEGLSIKDFVLNGAVKGKLHDDIVAFTRTTGYTINPAVKHTSVALAFKRMAKNILACLKTVISVQTEKLSAKATSSNNARLYVLTTAGTYFNTFQDVTPTPSFDFVAYMGRECVALTEATTTSTDPVLKKFAVDISYIDGLLRTVDGSKVGPLADAVLLFTKVAKVKATATSIATNAPLVVGTNNTVPVGAPLQSDDEPMASEADDMLAPAEDLVLSDAEPIVETQAFLAENEKRVKQAAADAAAAAAAYTASRPTQSLQPVQRFQATRGAV